MGSERVGSERVFEEKRGEKEEERGETSVILFNLPSSSPLSLSSVSISVSISSHTRSAAQQALKQEISRSTSYPPL